MPHIILTTERVEFSGEVNKFDIVTEAGSDEWTITAHGVNGLDTHTKRSLVTTWVCECESNHWEFLEMSVEEYAGMKPGQYVIMNGCPNGPLEGDKLIKEGDGWKIYEGELYNV